MGPGEGNLRLAQLLLVPWICGASSLFMFFVDIGLMSGIAAVNLYMVLWGFQLQECEFPTNISRCLGFNAL